ncbi:LysR family transcriptional regulator [Propionivibrio sp.]|jgi:DNA-binding transcriptional LysR family regulator|uniref:LysR family transcriptional regulator n=1 Tax=Propionivibrio sp. TaxID=2212460 RepID=UPI0039E44162
MDESDWKIIVELHKTPNITRTAERLFMTQPTLSKRLQMIESSLGARLVLRFSKGVVFTPEGEYVAGQASRVLAQMDEIRKNLLRIGDGQSGTIKLGMTNAFARFTIPPLLMQYKQLHPDVEFDIATDISAGIIKMLADNQVHVGFVRGDMEGDFERELISTEQACLVSKNEISLEDLPKLPQITYLKDPFARKLLDEWWSGHFSKPPLIGMHANHGDTCHEMIANGLGYGIFLSPNFVNHSRGLYRQPLFYKDGRPLVRNSWMVWNKEFSDVPLVKGFLGHMRERLLGPAEKPGRRKRK